MQVINLIEDKIKEGNKQVVKILESGLQAMVSRKYEEIGSTNALHDAIDAFFNTEPTCFQKLGRCTSTLTTILICELALVHLATLALVDLFHVQFSNLSPFYMVATHTIEFDFRT
jgi:hypothetical protein